MSTRISEPPDENGDRLLPVRVARKREAVSGNGVSWTWLHDVGLFLTFILTALPAGDRWARNWRWVVVLIAPLMLNTCNEPKTDHATLVNVEAAQRAGAEDNGEIVCARQGSNDFARLCTVEREQGADGLILTVRHADGAFHRLLVTKDGRGVVAADGAEKAVVTILNKDSIEVALGGDRYRLPATVRARPKPKS